jgi:hypothetical protein
VRWNALGIVHPHIPSAGLYSDSVARYTAFKLKGGPPPKCCRVITYLPRAVTYLLLYLSYLPAPAAGPALNSALRLGNSHYILGENLGEGQGKGDGEEEGEGVREKEKEEDLFPT